MAHEYTATIRWTRGRSETFSDNRYSRGHVWAFDGGIDGAGLRRRPPSCRCPCRGRMRSIRRRPSWRRCRAATCSPSSSIAAKKRFVVDAYEDKALGIMTKNENGKLFVSKVTLDPGNRVLGRQGSDAGADRRHAPPRPQGMLHRQFRPHGDRGGGHSLALTHPRFFADALSSPLRHRPQRDARADRRQPRRRPLRRRARRACC